MYQYYQLIESEEHYLYAHEIAKSFDIYSVASIKAVREDRHPEMMLTGLLKQEEEATGKKPMYYNTRNGLRRVFDSDVISTAALRLATAPVDENGIRYISINCKNYRYATSREERDAIARFLFPEFYNADGSEIELTDSNSRNYRRAQLGMRKKGYVRKVDMQNGKRRT